MATVCVLHETACTACQGHDGEVTHEALHQTRHGLDGSCLLLQVFLATEAAAYFLSSTGTVASHLTEAPFTLLSVSALLVWPCL